MNITQNQIIAVVILAMILFGFYIWNCRSQENFNAQFGAGANIAIGNQVGDFGDYSQISREINTIQEQLQEDQSFLQEFPVPYNVHSEQSSQVGASETVEEHGASLKDVLEKELELMNAVIPAQALKEIRSGMIPQEVIRLSHTNSNITTDVQRDMVQKQQAILQEMPTNEEIRNAQYQAIDQQQQRDIQTSEELIENAIPKQTAQQIAQQTPAQGNNTLLYLGLGLLVIWIIYNYFMRV